MLQFIAQPHNRYSVAESVQMAIEGGCGWIQLSLPGQTDDDIKTMSADIIEMCRDAGAFLTIENRPELAKELGIHGVHLEKLGNHTAGYFRELLGPEAVIGITADSAAAILAIRNADIDYVALPPTMSFEAIAELISTVRDAGVEIPIVATGDISAEDVVVYKTAGVSGIATGRPIVDSADPVSEVKRTIEALRATID